MRKEDVWGCRAPRTFFFSCSKRLGELQDTGAETGDAARSTAVGVGFHAAALVAARALAFPAEIRLE